MKRFAALLVGVVFGLTLSWSGMTNPEVLREGLLFHDAYLMLFFASALGTAMLRAMSEQQIARYMDLTSSKASSSEKTE